MIVRLNEASRVKAADDQTGSRLNKNESHTTADDALLSPSIQRTLGERIPAFELKLVLPETLARTLEAWAEQRMQRDQFGNPEDGGAYQTTTLYLDTPQFDVFHRSPGFRRRKYRLRRYGLESRIYFERKSRRGDRVRKRRSDALLHDLPRLVADEAAAEWSGAWFRERIALHSLLPACRVTYRRTAFVQASDQGPVRLTFDREIRGVSDGSWDLTPVDGGDCLLDGAVVCEFKFRESLPALFKQVIVDLQLQSGSMSKYRRLMARHGLGTAQGRQNG